MKKYIARFLNDQSGATAIEYGIIVSLIAIVVIVGATNVGVNINAKFNNIAGKLT